MFRCPLCGASARIRTSRPENDSNTVRQKYYQCNNLECGVCFSTLEAFVTNGAIVIHTQRLKSDPGGNLLS